MQALALHEPLQAGEAAPVSTVGLPIRFDGERTFNGHLGKRVGEDSAAVLAAAGVAAGKIAALARQGVVRDGDLLA